MFIINYKICLIVFVYVLSGDDIWLVLYILKVFVEWCEYK